MSQEIASELGQAIMTLCTYIGGGAILLALLLGVANFIWSEFKKLSK